MTINKDELRRLAEAATPGPWVADGEGGERYVSREEFDDIGVISVMAYDWSKDKQRFTDGEQTKANQDYIAAANPATILALLDELEAAQKDAERWRAVRNKAYVSGAGWTFSCRFKPIDKYDFNKTGEAKIQALEAAIDASMQEQKP